MNSCITAIDIVHVLSLTYDSRIDNATVWTSQYRHGAWLTIGLNLQEDLELEVSRPFEESLQPNECLSQRQLAHKLCYISSITPLFSLLPHAPSHYKQPNHSIPKQALIGVSGDFAPEERLEAGVLNMERYNERKLQERARVAKGCIREMPGGNPFCARDRAVAAADTLSRRERELRERGPDWEKPLSIGDFRKGLNRPQLEGSVGKFRKGPSKLF